MKSQPKKELLRQYKRAIKSLKKPISTLHTFHQGKLLRKVSRTKRKFL